MNESLRQTLTLEMAAVPTDWDTAPASIPQEDIVQLDSLVQRHAAKLDRTSIRQIVLTAYRLGSEHCHRAMESEVDDDATLTMAELEKRAVVRAFTIAKGNVTIAARLLAIGRTSLYRKLRKYGMLQGRRRPCPNCGYDQFHCLEVKDQRPDEPLHTQHFD